MDIIEMRAQLEEVALGIARFMPEGWTLEVPKAEDDISDRKFFRKGAMRIGISLDWQKKDRLNISTWTWPTYTAKDRYNDRGMRTETVWPRDLWDPEEKGSPDISVAVSRGPEVIAKEIKRRFLPEYERIWARCKKKADSYQRDNDTANAQWEEVCKLLGKDPKYDNHYNALGPFGVQNSNGSLKLEGYVTLEQLKALAKLDVLRKMPKDES